MTEKENIVQENKGADTKLGATLNKKYIISNSIKILSIIF